jgi:hypothetical protein
LVAFRHHLAACQHFSHLHGFGDIGRLQGKA